MKYQLIFQFRASDVNDFDELVALEEKLVEHLAPPSEVDGHDFGQDEFNIFILIDDPKGAFAQSEQIIQEQHRKQEMKVAYRALDQDEYTILWPPTAESFRIA